MFSLFFFISLVSLFFIFLWLFRILKNLVSFECFFCVFHSSNFFHSFIHLFFYYLDLLLLELFCFTFTFLTFFFTTIFLFVSEKTLQIIFCTCMHYLFMSPFCSSIGLSVVSFFSSCFLVSIHMCFPFLSFVFSVYDLLLTQVFDNICTSGIFTLLFGTFTALFVFACLSFLFVLFFLFFKKSFNFFFIPVCIWTFSFFCPCSLISVFSPLFCPYWMYVFFWWISLIWFSFFSFFFFFEKMLYFYILSFKIKKIRCFSCVSPFLFSKGRNFLLCFLLLPFFLFFRRRIFFLVVRVDSFWSFLFCLFTFPIQKTFS